MSEKTQWVVFDLEGDSLSPTKIYVLSYEDYEGNKGSILDYGDIRDFFTRYSVYVGHNVRQFDLVVLRRLVGIEVPERVVDTLALSWALYPERNSHGLESWGETLGFPKPDVTDWVNLDIKVYIERCEADVEINVRLWKLMMTKLYAIYEDWAAIWRYIGYLDFKLKCVVLQEQSGWKLDVELCEKTIRDLSDIKEAKTEELRKKMPHVKITTTRRRPAQLLKQDGTYTKRALEWFSLLDDLGEPLNTEEVEIVMGYEEGNPNSSEQKKAWLFSLGWVPATIKHQRNKTTGEIKEIPQINKEASKGGGVCESVLVLAEKDPAVLLLEGLGVLSHRIGILNGFLRDRDSRDYLHARVAGFTNTLRFRHRELVNLPKIEKEYAENLRACLTAPDDDHELCGSDMAGVEDRIKQHFLYDFDPEYVQSLQSDDYDPHIDIAVLAGMMTPDEADAYKAGDHSKKPVRSIAKNGNYACQYGAGVPRLVLTCGISRDAAQKVYDAYWERNWAIKAVAKDQTTKLVDGELWLYNPISGFWYSLRNEKDIFSTLVQGTAAYVFDLWLMRVYKRRPEFTGQFHDEVILTIKKGNRDACHQLLKECIEEANGLLQLNVPLDVDVQFGSRYSEIH